MQCIQVAQAMQAQDDGALHGGLINGHTLSGTRTQGQNCYAPILHWRLVDLIQQCVGSDPEKFAFLYGTQQMFGGFGLEADTCLTLVVKRPIQTTGIEIDPCGHSCTFSPGGMWPLRPCLTSGHSTCASAASACGSQKVMSMAWYSAMAVDSSARA